MIKGREEGKFVVFKVTHPDTYGDYCIFREWEDIYDAELDCAEIGQQISVQTVEMTIEELDDLPEFEGW